MNEITGVAKFAAKSPEDELANKGRVFKESLAPLIGAGPIALMRLLYDTSKKLGSNTMTYHLMDPVEPMRAHPAYSHFAKSRSLSRKRIEPRIEAEIVKTHALVLKRGVPTSISSLLPKFIENNPDKTSEIMRRIEEIGVADELMIPTYGPNSIDAVISFGFPCLISSVSNWKLELLESTALLCHAKMVRHFQNRQPRVKLSKRERAVLTWIARGKSNSEIAQILDLSGSSVDTYVRRIFEKFDVTSRVSAAVRGLLIGAITA